MVVNARIGYCPIYCERYCPNYRRFVGLNVVSYSCNLLMNITYDYFTYHNMIKDFYGDDDDGIHS